MRWIFLLFILSLLLGSIMAQGPTPDAAANATLTAQALQNPPSGDFGATATAIIVRATQTARSRQSATEPVPTRGLDSFQLTATELVRQATQQAIDANITPEGTPIPPDVSEAEVALTATALVAQATAQAANDSGGDPAAGDSDDNETPFTFAALITAALVAIVSAIGALFSRGADDKV